MTSDPAAIDPRIVASVQVVAVRGPNARASLEALAAVLRGQTTVSGETRGLTPVFAEPLRAPGESEALLWFRHSGLAPQLVTLPPRTHPDRPIRNDVGRLLRRA